MELDYLTGVRLSSSPFDVNGNGAFEQGDLLTYTGTNGIDEQVAVSGVQLNIGITPTPTVITSESPVEEYKEFSGTSGQTEGVKESVPPAQKGRINWQELIQ
jgi:type IV pilus assembly protein PilY1